MTPAARLSAAIELLDLILAGAPAGLTLTNWGRQSRYAGSRDRAAVRDIVFDCLRSKRSFAHLSGQDTGRGLVLALCYQQDREIETLFTGEKYAPDTALPDEMEALARADVPEDPVRLNYPDFLDSELKRSLGDSFEAVMAAMSHRAPVDLRVNRLKGDLATAVASLATDEIGTAPVSGVPTALRVVENPRRVAQSKAYRDGLVELQDASSQAVSWFAGAQPGMRVLDYCAGGGGKSLALYDAIEGNGSVIAHDIATVRMNDLPARAARAGARITIARPGHHELRAGSFDLVFVDAPCSGTGSWRRTPDAKWRLRESDIEGLRQVQAQILDQAAGFLKPDGVLVYATCSVLSWENIDQVTGFTDRNRAFECDAVQQLTPLTCGDGFFAARLIKK